MPKVTLEEVVAYFDRPILLTEHNCWLWQGSTDNYGYARHSGKLVYMIVCRWVGKLTKDGEDLCHTCPNHNCINPDHFYVGTHKENMNDDNRLPMGPKGKLSQEQIGELNLMLAKGMPKGMIAHHFGMSPQWISKFLRGDFVYAKPIRTPE